MNQTCNDPIRCGIVLAAGDGKRLQPLIQRLRGDTLPKQYVSFIGSRSMLEHTFDRVEKVISHERVFTVVSQDHLLHPAVARQLSSRSKGTVIAQPENKDTGPGVLLPLMHLAKRHPDCTVAVFPSDHFVLEEDLFMSHVSFAFQVVERNPSLLVLLGVEPDQPEPEYGYVLPHGDGNGKSPGLSIRRVSRFVEKPERDAARDLICKGGLWNTMVMVFKVNTLLDIVREVEPKLCASFEEVFKAIGTRKEKSRLRAIYQRLAPTNFSRGVLEMLPLSRPSCLSVLAVRDVLWSDWGLPRSIEAVLIKTGHLAPRYEINGYSESPLHRLFSDGLEQAAGAEKAPIRREKLLRATHRPALSP
ncbi:MAG TPA: sugar phosphate nucleotidyltransferase [Candidatus Binatia bacterium]